MNQRVTTFFALFFLFFVWKTTSAQPKQATPISEKEKAHFAQKLTQSLRTIKTISCDFTEEKNSSLLTQVAVTQGVMYYQAPNSIRWEYGAPSNLQFVLFGGKMTTKKDGKINAVPNKMAKEMAQIIANLINGGALANEKEFKIQYFTHQNDIWVVLTPKNAMLRQMYDKFELQLSDNQYVAKKIIMYEVGGDKTTTTFKNHKVNQPLPKDLFTLKP